MKRISIEGVSSREPRWSVPNQELIFATEEISGSGEMQIFTAMYRVDEGVFFPDRPVRWKGGTAYRGFRTTYDLHPDGQKILVRKLVEEDTEQTFDHVVLFENFFDYVREQLSTSEN